MGTNNSKPLWCGLGHRRNTGKNQLAEYMWQELTNRGISARTCSFASELKIICQQLFHSYGMRSGEYYEANREDKETTLEGLAWTPRDLMIKTGLFFRDVDENYWVKKLMDDAYNKQFEVCIITDLRFPNEYEAIKSRGGVCIKVHRPSVPAYDDAADCALEGTEWDNVVFNNGGLEKLRRVAAELVDNL